jgi:hypothetical protein
MICSSVNRLLRIGRSPRDRLNYQMEGIPGSRSEPIRDDAVCPEKFDGTSLNL